MQVRTTQIDYRERSDSQDSIGNLEEWRNLDELLDTKEVCVNKKKNDDEEDGEAEENEDAAKKKKKKKKNKKKKKKGVDNLEAPNDHHLFSNSNRV